MTRSFDSCSVVSVSDQTRQKMTRLMDRGMSLIQASQALKIPYKLAK